jgi:ankyrin repeat protein
MQRAWSNVDELLRYMGASFPFDRDAPFEPKLISAHSTLPEGDTPLHLASAWGDARAVELLLSAGAGVNAQCGFGRTPLALAVSSGHVAVAKLLLSHGAAPDMQSEFGDSPRSLALSGTSAEMRHLFSSSAT